MHTDIERERERERGGEEDRERERGIEAHLHVRAGSPEIFDGVHKMWERLACKGWRRADGVAVYNGTVSQCMTWPG